MNSVQNYSTNSEDKIRKVAGIVEWCNQNPKRIIIFGWSPNWRQKLKEQLLVVEFVDVDERNRDISKIQRVDAVFLNTSLFAHSFYKKIIKELSKSKTPLYYLNRQNNMEKSIAEIYEWLIVE